MSTIIASNLQASGGTGTAATLASINGGPIAGSRSRIINGSMVIDQRNAGAALTVNAAALFFPVDRFAGFGQASDGVFTVQRSTTAPNGFTNSLLATVTTADTSLGATQEYGIIHYIEGYNVADLGWGAAGASAVTLSFWVRSSVTGTHSGSISNSSYTRSYVFSYSISSANTWEYKTIAIPGDTTGTWLTDNGVGLRLRWSLGHGSTYVGAAGSWVGTFIGAATGSVNVIGTNGATWQITGVQLEQGSVATPFERRSYGQELALCQRYYQDSLNPISSGGAAGASATTGELDAGITFKCNMRTAPTITLYDEAGTAGKVSRLLVGTSWGNGSTGSTFSISTFGFGLQSASGTNAHGVFARYTASAEL